MRGVIQSYIGSLERQREGEANGGAIDRLVARENADIREVLLDTGVATAEELDSAGYLSHEDLDRHAEEGTLEEAFGLIDPLKLAAIARRRRRSSGGQFADEFSSLAEPKKLRGRGGKALPTPKAPKAKTVKPDAPDPPDKPKAPAPPKPKEPSQAAKAKAAVMPAVRETLEKVRHLGLNDWPEKGEVALRLLGNAADTQELYTRPLPASPGTKGSEPRRAYTKKRKVTHDKAMGKFLGDALEDLLGPDHPTLAKLRQGIAVSDLSEEERQEIRDAASEARGGARPAALVMAGGMAAGKTSALEAGAIVAPESTVLVNPDDIKEEIPEYGQMTEAGEKFAASGVHEESADLAKRLLTEAEGLGLNVLFDTGGNSKKGKFVSKLEGLKEAGYDVEVGYVTIETDDGVVRGISRAQKNGRWPPEPALRSHHRSVSANFNDVAALDYVALKVFDNSTPPGEPPVLVAQKDRGGELQHRGRHPHGAVLVEG